MTQDRQATELAGMNAHVAKPIDARELVSALLKWVPPQAPKVLTGTVLQSAVLSSSDAFDIPGLDIAGAVFNLDHDWELLRHIMLSFYDDFADAPQRLDAHLAAGEWQDAERLVHTVKGLAHSVGATDLQAIGKRFEIELHERESSLQDEFKHELKGVLERIAILKPAEQSSESAATPEHLRELLQRLAESITAFTLVPHDFKDQVSRALVGHVEPKLADELMRHIGQLDYESAQVTLDLIAQRLGVTLDV
jgi:HPt (histidine-containing phosphotransfer) domain-containing protein